MTGGLFFVQYCNLPPSSAAPFLRSHSYSDAPFLRYHSSDAAPSYAAILLILSLFLRCLPSYAAPFLPCYRSDALYAAILLTLPPFWCPLPCHLLTLSLFWCPLIISTAELRSFVGSVNLTSVACSSGSPDKSDHRQTQWRGKWIALSMDFVTTILPIKFKFWLRSQ